MEGGEPKGPSLMILGVVAQNIWWKGGLGVVFWEQLRSTGL